MGFRRYNVQIGPRGRTTSIVSQDGVHWFTEDGKPVDEKDICHDNAGAELIGIVMVVSVMVGLCRLLFG